MRQLRSAEELRKANAARQKKWRDKNKVLARERRLYVYGKAKYPQMVEENSREAKRALEEVKEAEEAPHITNNPQKPILESRVVSVEDDPLDCRTEMEKRQHREQREYYARRAFKAGVGKEEDPLQKVVERTAEEAGTITNAQQAMQWVNRKQRERQSGLEKKGVKVEGFE
jgi:hypothetical protein